MPYAPPSSFAALSPRDHEVIAATLAKLGDARPSFELAAAALHEAVVERIPAGRVFILGVTSGGPILGSLISGVGIATIEREIVLVRVDRTGAVRQLGSLLSCAG